MRLGAELQLIMMRQKRYLCPFPSKTTELEQILVPRQKSTITEAFLRPMTIQKKYMTQAPKKMLQSEKKIIQPNVKYRQLPTITHLFSQAYGSAREKSPIRE